MVADLLDYGPQKNGITYLLLSLHKSPQAEPNYNLFFLDDWVSQTFKQMRKGTHRKGDFSGGD